MPTDEKPDKLTVKSTLRDLLDADYDVARPWLAKFLKAHLGTLGKSFLPIVDELKESLEDRL